MTKKKNKKKSKKQLDEIQSSNKSKATKPSKNAKKSKRKSITKASNDNLQKPIETPRSDELDSEEEISQTMVTLNVSQKDTTTYVKRAETQIGAQTAAPLAKKVKAPRTCSLQDWLKPPDSEVTSEKVPCEPVNTFRSPPTTKPTNTRSYIKTWLNLNNNNSPTVGDQIQVNEISSTEPSSVCRPGTLYSDVLFGVVNNELVCSKNNEEVTSSYDIEKDVQTLNIDVTTRENFVWPVLKTKAKSESAPKPESAESVYIPTPIGPPKRENAPRSSSETPPSESDEKDWREKMSLYSFRALGDALQPGSDLLYLQQNVCNLMERRYKQRKNFNHYNNNGYNERSSTSSSGTSFNSFSDMNIDAFNFTDIDLTPSGFPRSLNQFDDERYKRAEEIVFRRMQLHFSCKNNDDDAKPEI